MNTSLKIAALAVVSAASSALASVTIDISGGALFNSAGAPLADGSLLYAVSSASNVFPTGADASTSISVGDFTFGDNVLLGSTVVDSGVAGPGTFDLILSGLNLSGGVSAGNHIALFWIPTFSGSSTSNTAALIKGVSYGVYVDPTWTVPAEGATVGYAVETVFIGGSIADSLTKATQLVGGSAIPEPSSFAALAGFAVLGLAASRRRRA